MAGPAARTMPSVAAARAAGDGRVMRNMNIVVGFWLANGLLRLIEVGGMMIFRRLLFQDGWGWLGSGRWPFGGSFGFSPFLMGEIHSAGILLALFGGVHLLLA